MATNIRLKIATTWNQLSFKQLKQIATDIHVAEETWPKNEDEKNQALYLAFWKTLLRENSMHSTHYALKEIPIADVVPHVKFLFSGIKRTTWLPALKVGMFKTYAPGTRLNNISIAEFSLADAAFYMWRTQQDEQYLNLLCAVLYRPKAWFKNNPTDKRVPFNKFAAELRSKRFKNINLQTKLAIVLCFEGCRNHLTDSRKHLFPKSEGNENHTYQGFQKIILAKSGGKFGDFYTTNKALAVDFLNELEEELKTAKD